MRPQDFRLSARITAAALFTVVAGVMTWVLAENARFRDAYIRERRIVLEESLHAETLRLQRAVSALREDTLFLSSTPPVFGLMRARLNNGFDPVDGNTAAKWETRMQEIFSAFARAHADYYRISFIGVADDGRELVRVENVDGNIAAAPPGALAGRGQADYFRAVRGLRERQVWLSEFGSAEESGDMHTYRLSAATPVFGADGKLFGMLMVSMDSGDLLKSAAAGLPLGVETSVAAMDGHYLLRTGVLPSPGERAGSTLALDFPSLAGMLAPQSEDYRPLDISGTRTGRQYLAAARIRFDPEHPDRFLVLVYGIPEQAVAHQVNAIPAAQVVGGFIVMLVVGGLAWLVLRQTFAPLAQITRSAERIIEGDRSVRLPLIRGGEIGTLSRALNTMLDKLSQREDAFRKELAESLPGIFYVIDAGGRFRMWNRNLEKVLHCSAAEIAQAHPLDFFDGEDARRIEAAIRKVFESGEVSVEAVLVAKDGARTHYHFTGRRVIRNGEPVLIGLGTDMSEQYESMREATRMLQRNQALMQSSMEGIHVLDMNGNVVDANEAFCRMLGYTREEALRLNLTDWDRRFTPEEFRARLKQIIGTSGTFEVMHWRKDGTPMHIELCTTGLEIDGEHYVFAASRDITERKKAEAVLLGYKVVVNTAMDGFWMVDMQGNLLEVNDAYARMTGYTTEELMRMKISDLEAAETPEQVRAHVENIMRAGQDRFETRHRCKDGGVLEIEVSVSFMPEQKQFFVFSRDITERKRAEESLRVAAATFETHDAILITDRHASIVRVNQAFTDITGYRPDEVLGKNPRIMSSGRHDRSFYIEMWQQLLHTGSWAGEIWDRRKNGQVYPKWMTISAVRNERQETTHYVAIFSDITARKQAEEEIRNLAFYDALTRLPNRRLFMDRFRAALTISARRNSYGAVLFIDLDRFKVLNDTLGHDYGDQLLIEVAARIKSCVREMDTVARLGGDEFVVLLEDVSEDQEEASHKVGVVAEKIRETLTHPYHLKDREHHSSPSIGISLYRGNELPVDEVLQRADMAMYQAKSAGRNAARFFDPVMQRNVTTRAALENDLHHAVARSQLQLHYQIQVDNDHRPLGAEALLRWLHPERGMVMPG